MSKLYFCKNFPQISKENKYWDSFFYHVIPNLVHYYFSHIWSRITLNKKLVKRSTVEDVILLKISIFSIWFWPQPQSVTKKQYLWITILIFARKLLLLLYRTTTLRTVIYLNSPLLWGWNSSSYKQLQMQQSQNTLENLAAELALCYEAEEGFETTSLAPTTKIISCFVCFDLGSGI